MAGNWIPVSKGLSRKREVVAIASATSRSRYEVVGLLLDFWAWVDEESTDGRLPGITPSSLTTIIAGSDEAFWKAVLSAGWLVNRSAGLEVPNFQRWLGRSAKRRLMDSERKRNVRNLSASDTDKSGTTTQHNTTQHKRDPPAPHPGDKRRGRAVDSLDPLFDQFWRAYPNQSAKLEARKAWDELNVDEALLKIMLDAIAVQKKTDKWIAGMVMNPDKWLRGERWKDKGIVETKNEDLPAKLAQQIQEREIYVTERKQMQSNPRRSIQDRVRQAKGDAS